MNSKEQTALELRKYTRSLVEQGHILLAFFIALFALIWAAVPDNRRDSSQPLQLPEICSSQSTFDREAATQWLNEQAVSVAKMLKDGQIQNATVYSRVKSDESAKEKAERKNVAVTDLKDLYGMRVVVQNELDVYETLNIICSEFEMVPGTMKNYIISPKASGYQSVHVVAQVDGRNVEFQLRTESMHEQAEAEHEAYKSRMRLAA